MDWYLDILRTQYADFDGRVRRREFWMFALVNLAVYAAAMVLAGIVGVVSDLLAGLVWLAYAAFAVGVLVPSVAIAVRRLHDTGRTGWLALLGMIPIANFVLLYFLILEGDAGPNAYGPDLKAAGLDGFPGDLG